MTASTDCGLEPRAIAALCALRTGPRSTIQLRNAIGEQGTNATRHLMGDVRDLGLIEMMPGGSWQLTMQGIAWCDTHGLVVDPEAKIAVLGAAS